MNGREMIAASVTNGASRSCTVEGVSSLVVSSTEAEHQLDVWQMQVIFSKTHACHALP